MYHATVKVVCPKCGGSGVDHTGRKDCPVCRGKGTIIRRG